MKFYIYANPTSEEAARHAERLDALIREAGQERAEDLAAADALAVIGGDGTVLHAVRELVDHSLPIWAINGGHLGYLTESEPQDMADDLQRIIAGEYRLEQRIMMSGAIESSDFSKRFFALNEAVLHRGGGMHSLHVMVAVDGSMVLRFAGDGVLISTPTGSTAYNLSAGGPILMPEAGDLAITPICAHSALSASIVVPGSSRIAIRLESGEEATGALPQLVVDGSESIPIHVGHAVFCEAAHEAVRFIRMRSGSFYLRLQQRLTQRSR